MITKSQKLGLWKSTLLREETFRGGMDTQWATDVESLACDLMWFRYQYCNRRLSPARGGLPFLQTGAQQGHSGAVLTFPWIHSASLKFTLWRNWIFKACELSSKLCRVPTKVFSLCSSIIFSCCTLVPGFDQRRLEDATQSSVAFLCLLGLS